MPPRSRLFVPGVFKLSCSTPFTHFQCLVSSLVSSFCLPALSPIFHSKNSPHNASVFSSLLATDLCLPSHSPVFICITALFLYSTSLTLSSPSYNRTGWLGIKHQVTSLLFPVSIFHSVLVWRRSVPFCLGRCRINSLVSFFVLFCLAWACSLAFLSLWVPFLAISRDILINLVLFSGLF